MDVQTTLNRHGGYMKLLTDRTLIVIRLLHLISSNERITAKTLGERLGNNEHNVSKITQSLRRADILQSGVGRSGGYSFAKDPSTVTLWEVMCAIQPDTDTTSVSYPKNWSGNEFTKSLEERLGTINENMTALVKAILQSTPLADIFEDMESETDQAQRETVAST